MVAEFARARAQSRPLGPQHQRHRPAGQRGGHGADLGLALAVEAQHCIAHVLERLDRISEVLDPQVGLAFQRARGGLGQRTGLGRGVAGGRDDGARAEHLGRAQDRAHVMRIGDLVEQDQPRGARTIGHRHVLEPAPVQWLDLKCCPLVHRSRIERGGKLARVRDLGGQAARGDGVGQLVLGILGQNEAQLDARTVHQRIAYGVQPEEPHGLCGGRTAPAFLVDDPAWFLRHAPSPGPDCRKGLRAADPLAKARESPRFPVDAPCPPDYPAHRVGRRAARCGSGL